MTEYDYINELRGLTFKYIYSMSVNDILNCQYSFLIHSLRASADNPEEFKKLVFETIEHMYKICEKYVECFDELEKLAEKMHESKD